MEKLFNIMFSPWIDDNGNYIIDAETATQTAKDAWNAALDWAAENAEIRKTDFMRDAKWYIDRQSILKGKIK